MNIDYLNSKRRLAEKTFGWDCRMITLGLNELRTGIVCVDNFKVALQPTILSATITKPEKRWHYMCSTTEIIGSTYRNTVEKLPAKLRESLLPFAMEGWFIDPEFEIPTIFELHRQLTQDGIDEVNSRFSHYYRENLVRIMETLILLYPDRAKIISSAFRAHERAEYELSIPILLSQSDGICQELVKMELYKKKNRKPLIAVYFNSLPENSFFAAFFDPLSHCLPLSASASERLENFSSLNRHQILHGESTLYCTEINSLKSVSLIAYIGLLLNENKL